MGATFPDKLDRIPSAISLLLRHEKESFFDRVSTGDEKWKFNANRQCKRNWKQVSEFPEPVVKVGLHAMNLFSVLWDCRRRNQQLQRSIATNSSIPEKNSYLKNRNALIFHRILQNRLYRSLNGLKLETH